MADPSPAELDDNPTATGDCFRVAVERMKAHFEAGSANVRLVHARILGQGPIDGVRHWHAWVEFDQELPFPGIERPVVSRRAEDRSNGKRVNMPVDLFRRIADPEQVREYDFDAMVDQLAAHMQYGPWPDSTGD